MRPESMLPRVTRSGVAVLPDESAWSRVSPLALNRCGDGAPPSQSTRVRVARDAEALLIRFECEDRDVWATYTGRDEPLWEEEVVEVFLAPGGDDPVEYFEFEVNPLGTIFDARVANPHGRRDSMRVDAGWNAEGLLASVEMLPAGSWRVDLVIPWRDVCTGEVPEVWRANFFRIDRPRGGEAEHSCWSPTLTSPPDFHKPASFGTLIFGPGDEHE